MEIRREHADLSEERDGIVAMLASDRMQWKLVGSGLDSARAALISMKAQLPPHASIGARRSTFSDAPDIDVDAAAEAMVPREPITVILSDKGWIRAAKGRVEDPSELKFKEGDKLGFLVPAETTDKLLIFASDGRFFTIACANLPGARGHGEPLRLMIELDDRVNIVDVFPHKAGAKRMIASKEGYGFILPEDEALANRKAGKQVLNGEALVSLPATGDQVAVIGDNGKLLIFPLAELPEMPRGKGVKLQGYKEGGLRDVAVFASDEGLTTVDASGRTRAWPEWREWTGRRTASGRLAPKGFPATKRFRPR
jgi:topoisomerase-4 subunit A